MPVAYVGDDPRENLRGSGSGEGNGMEGNLFRCVNEWATTFGSWSSILLGTVVKLISELYDLRAKKLECLSHNSVPL